MTVAYVTMPGTSGNYVDTDQVNLLSADTAHIQQSLGQWGGYVTGTNSVTPSVSQDVTPVFGDNVLKVDITAVSTGRAGVLMSGVAASITPGINAYTGSGWVYSDTAFSGELYMEFKLGGSGVNDSGIVAFSHTGSGWERFTVSGTSAATPDNIHLWWWVVNPAAPFAVYGDAFQIEQAASATAFVPSLRIVGDLDMRARFAATDATPTTAETLIGQRSGNNGYAMTLGTGGELVVYHGTGSGTRQETSSGLSLTAATATEVRSTLDISAGTWTHYKNGVQFDSSGSFATTAGSPYSGPLAVGADSAGTSGNWDGDIYFAEVRDGIDGPVVRRFDADDLIGLV